MKKSVIIDGIEYVPKPQGLALLINDISVTYDRGPVYAGGSGLRYLSSKVISTEHSAQISFGNSQYEIDIPEKLFDEIVEEARKYGNRH